MAGARVKLRKHIARLLTPPLRSLSPALAGRSLHRLGRLDRFRPGTHRSLVAALERWQEALGTSWNLDAQARALAGNRFRFLARDYALDGLPLRVFDDTVRATGRDHLESALQQGKGVLLLLNHYGSQMIPSHWMLRQGYPYRVYMERPNSISNYLARRFAEEGPLGQASLFISRREDDTAGSAASVMKAAQMVKRGMILGIAGDVRWTGSSTAPARFLGVEQSFTATWVILTRLTQAPIVPTFCRMLPDGRFELSFLPSLDLPSTNASRDKLAPAVQLSLALVEDHIRLDPSNAVEYLGWPEIFKPLPASPDSPHRTQAA